MSKDNNGDWVPGLEKEQGELLDSGTYECVIAEVPVYHKDHTWQGVTKRIQRTHVALEVDAVRKDGKRFVVTSKQGHPSFDDRSNLVTEFCIHLGLDEIKAGCKEAKGINGYLVGRGVKVMIKPSVPKEEGGIKYNNIVPGTLEWSENGMVVSGDFQTQAQMFPDSQHAIKPTDNGDDDALPF